ncbi:MAG TPA: TAT-variant-translocated molybdopterin oxidoreductase, partial [Bryobacteraceae bacterium]|nr:TAT-variant-translocated molybdopterin oxidoreductase [Bryobacteraceae bacterium]
MIQITKKLTGRKYWKSLDQYYQTPEFQSWLHREFPEAATEAVDEHSRRNILKLMAASFGLGGLTACRRPLEHILPASKTIEAYIPGEPLLYNTAMTLGGTSMGLMVRTNDGRPTKIEGNPRHPLSQGRTRGFHQGSILNLYDPDRSYALTRGGTMVKPEEFFTFLNQWKGSVNGGGVRVLSERVTSPSLNALRQHFLGRFAGSRWFEYEPVATFEAGSASAPRLALDKADVVLALDSDLLGLDSTTVQHTRQFGLRRSQVDETKTMNRLYVVESQMSVTGGAADHRLPLKSSEIGRFASSLLNQIRATGGGLNNIATGA